MIQYALKCSEGHTFDSWFQSAEAFDKLLRGGMVTCAACGGTQVEKAIMTPRVRPARKSAKPEVEPKSERGALSRPANPAEKALAEMRRHVEKTADYVGRDFAAEARRMHLGEAPERSIYGEARAEEAKALIEEGVPVAPLPFMPNRKTN
ncbi:DUF1178 family protein [Cribrihabitans sp. XS_ASV171]